MLEICVSPRRGNQSEGNIAEGEKDSKKTGDIIVAKRFGSPWGNEERRLFLITLLEDDDLENKIPEGGIISYPYSCTKYIESSSSSNPENLSKLIITNRSKYRVKVGQVINDITQSNMFAGSPGIDPTNITSEPCSPTNKIGSRQFCKICNEIYDTAELCPICNKPMVEFLELSDLFFDDSDRT